MQAMKKSDSITANSDVSGENSRVSTPPTKLGAKLKQIAKKVRHSEGENDIPIDPLNGEAPNSSRKKVSIRDSADITSLNSVRDRTSRQKLLDEEAQRNGRAKSLGFNSIKAGLGRKEYEDFIKKSPIKPLALRMLDGAGGGGTRRSILVRMKTENGNLSGIMLPPLTRSSRDLGTARSDPDTSNGNSLEGSDGKNSLLRSSLSMKGNMTGGKGLGSGSNSLTNQNDDYAKDGFESSLESLDKQVAEEERLAKEADDAKATPAIAPFLLTELQADDLIDRRFGWQRTGSTSASHDARLDILTAVHSKSSDHESPLKRPIVKLGEMSPAGSMRGSIRSNMLGGGNKPPPPGKLTRKATMANLTGPTTTGVVPAPEPEAAENILEHYSGLLFRDPTSPNTWQELNSPKKTKTSLFQTQKQSLSAGRNINAYRPWGPARPVDPLDAILEKTMTQSYEDDDEQQQQQKQGNGHNRSYRGRKRTNSKDKSSANNSGRGSRPTSHRKSRRDSSNNSNNNNSISSRNYSPFGASPSPSGGRSGRSRSASNSESPRSRSRVSSAEGRPFTPSQTGGSGRSPSREGVRSGLVLESSMELNGQSHVEGGDPSALTIDDPASRASSPDLNRSAPSSATGKRRSPLIINFIKAPMGLYE